jgi:peptidoglycan hydrolase CwlO-like protein
MTVEISLLIAGLAMAFGIYSGIASRKRDARKDAQNDTAAMTTVIVKLENIQDELKEIKGEMSIIRSDFRDLRDKVITLEQSLKSAWSRIDDLKKTEGVR